jgi:hypothetical protein
MLTLERALQGMFDARQKLQSRDGITSLPVLSEQTDRLATYTSAVEDHLADLERSQELDEQKMYYESFQAGKSASAAEKEAKMATAKLKAEIKYLTRVTKASWALVSFKQSRWKHLEAEARGQV